MSFKKITAAFTAAALCLACLGGCSNSDDSSKGASQSETSSAAPVEKTPETPQEWHDAMIKKAMYSYGSTALMQEKIQKAQNGEEVTIAYLGGSITEGLTAGADDCYAKLSYEHFAEKYGKDGNVKYCNAGLSGTPSTLGVLRLERDVLASDPDICFIEFAVNDGTDSSYQNAYESIVRELLGRDIAVVLLFSVTAEDYSAQDYMKAIGEFYKLPMISYCDALRYMFENGQMKWEDFSDDQSHPNVEGHKIVAEMVNYYFDTVTDVEAEAAPLPEQSVYTPRLLGAHLYENTNFTPESMGSWVEGSDVARFQNGWTHPLEGGNEPIKFKFTGKFVYMIYKEVKQGKFGPVHVKVTCNGELYDEKDIEAVAPSGWGNPQIINIGMQPENTEYEIEITMAEGYEDNYMEILGFGYTIDD